MVKDILRFILEGDEESFKDVFAPEEREYSLEEIKTLTHKFFSRSNTRFFGTKKVYKYPGNYMVVKNVKMKPSHGMFGNHQEETTWVIYQFRRTEDTPQGDLFFVAHARDLEDAKWMIKHRDFRDWKHRAAGLIEGIEDEDFNWKEVMPTPDHEKMVAEMSKWNPYAHHDYDNYHASFIVPVWTPTGRLSRAHSYVGWVRMKGFTYADPPSWDEEVAAIMSVYPSKIPGFYPSKLQRSGFKVGMPWSRDHNRFVAEAVEDPGEFKDVHTTDIREIQVEGRVWYRRGAGGMYNTAKIWVNGAHVATLGENGGSGDMYLQRATAWLEDHGYISREHYEPLWRYCERHGIKLIKNAYEVRRERELHWPTMETEEEESKYFPLRLPPLPWSYRLEADDIGYWSARYYRDGVPHSYTERKDKVTTERMAREWTEKFNTLELTHPFRSGAWSSVWMWYRHYQPDDYVQETK